MSIISSSLLNKCFIHKLFSGLKISKESDNSLDMERVYKDNRRNWLLSLYSYQRNA